MVDHMPRFTMYDAPAHFIGNCWSSPTSGRNLSNTAYCGRGVVDDSSSMLFDQQSSIISRRESFQSQKIDPILDKPNRAIKKQPLNSARMRRE